MSKQPLTGALLQEYFRQKKNQILAMAAQAVAAHPGLKGNHREVVVSTYLNDIVPKRFQIDKGMIYTTVGQHSYETDIVIWDASNYPSLTMQGHSLFFVESVKAMLEVKTHWNTSELADIKRKCERIGRLYSVYEPGLEEEINNLWLAIHSLQTGEEYEGSLLSRFRIGTCAIALRGGENYALENISKDSLDEIDSSWPDLIILLEAGKVIIKNYVQSDTPSGYREYGVLHLISAGEDALLIFTARLLELLSERVVQIEEAFYLTRYTDLVLGDLQPSEKLEFPVFRPRPGRKFFMKEE